MKFFVIIITLSTFGEICAQDSTFYKDGELRSFGETNEGKKIGRWKFFYPSGKLSSIENYKNGELEGRVE